MIRLRNTLPFFFMLCTVSCTQVPQAPPAPNVPQLSVRASTSTPVIQENGRDVARHLTNRYADTQANCGRPTQPSFLCNGIMIRGTASNPTFHVWENSPASIAKGGVSASYLRKDSSFKKLAYGYTNGYILKAYFYASGKIHPEVLCFFPVDAGTSARADRGCGLFPGYPGSDLCHLNGVVTADDWWAHYTAHPSNRHSWQCAFDVSDDRDSLAAPAFAAGIGAMAKMGAESFETQNEFILSAWGNGLGRQLPLEAFFYLSGSPSGLNDAKRNQRDLMTTDNVWMPVIKVTLPQSQGASASFTFSESDQGTNQPKVITEDWGGEGITRLREGQQYAALKTGISISAPRLTGDDSIAGYIHNEGVYIYPRRALEFRFPQPATEISINIKRRMEPFGSYSEVEFYNGATLLHWEAAGQEENRVRYTSGAPITHFRVKAVKADAHFESLLVRDITWSSY